VAIPVMIVAVAATIVAIVPAIVAVPTIVPITPIATETMVVAAVGVLPARVLIRIRLGRGRRLDDEREYESTGDGARADKLLFGHAYLLIGATSPSSPPAIRIGSELP
jgi:hypothetical protein